MPDKVFHYVVVYSRVVEVEVERFKLDMHCLWEVNVQFFATAVMVLNSL